MAHAQDFTGQNFGRLTVLKRMVNNRWSHSCWLCRCDCGNEKTILGYNLTNGTTQSCGCLHKERASAAQRTHGYSKSKTYGSWVDMIRRCTQPHNKNYQHYGGRGIKVCKRWSKFVNFLEDMGEVPMGYQIDRIDNDQGYCKSNCRWATRKQQARNKQYNHLVTYQEKTLCLSEWAEQTGIAKDTIRHRLKNGWPVEKALTKPVQSHSGTLLE